MGRLIDADALLTKMSLNYNDHQVIAVHAMKNIIDTTKTAYVIDMTNEGDKTMNDLELLKTYCEMQITSSERIIENKRFVSKGRRRYLMGQVVGIEKVLARINILLAEKE